MPHTTSEHVISWHGRPPVNHPIRRGTRAIKFIAESEHSKHLLDLLKLVAPAHANTLIEGETGTGKEIVARLLHFGGCRSNGPFVAVNCKAFPSGLIESELFGHEKGSFTGAIATHIGCFERASGGTLFLDEIAEADADFQAKLLRAIDDREAVRVGGSTPFSFDVRIVAATNRVLRDEVVLGRFRPDLYFRLNVLPIRIRPLRERPGDILPLAEHILTALALETGRSLRLSAEVEHALLSYDWPGNVRELKNVIERAVVLSRTDVLCAGDIALEDAIADNAAQSAGTLQEYLDQATCEKIRAALKSAHGRRTAAAQALGIDRTTLYRLMTRFNVH